jgi:hypothetical protein
MKNDYRESESGGRKWLADEGAREAKYDGMGSLVSLPEKVTSADKYDTLLNNLYEIATEIAQFHGGDPATISSALESFSTRLARLDEAAAHQISAGLRDASKSTAKRGEGEGETLQGITVGTISAEDIITLRDAPPTDHPASPYSEDDVYTVRCWRHHYVSYEGIAQDCLAGNLLFAKGREEYFASIARHLAEMGE